MKIAFFGSSLVSAYWNGAATYYRGLIRALHARGHHVTFFEPDAYDRQQHRDIEPPFWARSVVYENSAAAAMQQVKLAAKADLIIKASGVGVFDEMLESQVLELKSENRLVAFWDVDAPATLSRVEDNATDPFCELIPRYDFIFTYGGGDPVVRRYLGLGAQVCVPIYNAHDPAMHHVVPRQQSFASDLSFLGNRLPDREQRVRDYFIGAAQALPDKFMILGGSGWGDVDLPPNLLYAGHVYTADHNAFNCSATAVLNLSRESMAENGFSPATRVFEAAAAGACIITDFWEGIEEFFEPGKEILVAHAPQELVEIVAGLKPDQARAIGSRARERARRDHTYTQRAEEFERAVGIGATP